MFAIDDNFTTNGSDGNYSDGYEREDFSLINLYLALPLRVIMSLAIITSASIVLLAIKKSKRHTKGLNFFFIANLMIADIGFAVIHNGAITLKMIVRMANPMSKGIGCKIKGVTAFTITANIIMLTALCFDRLYSVTAPHHYRRNMTKRRGYVIVSVIWLVSLLLSFTIFLDPHADNEKQADILCGAHLYKNFALVVVTLPLVLSSVFAVIQNIYLYCVVVKVTRNSNNNSDTSEAGIKTAWRTLKETKKASIVLLILTGTSILFGIVQQVTFAVLQAHVEYSMAKVIIYSSILPFIFNVNVLLHSILYGYFLRSIRQSLGHNICHCFCISSE